MTSLFLEYAAFNKSCTSFSDSITGLRSSVLKYSIAVPGLQLGYLHGITIALHLLDFNRGFNACAFALVVE